MRLIELFTTRLAAVVVATGLPADASSIPHCPTQSTASLASARLYIGGVNSQPRFRTAFALPLYRWRLIGNCPVVYFDCKVVIIVFVRFG